MITKGFLPHPTVCHCSIVSKRLNVLYKFFHRFSPIIVVFSELTKLGNSDRVTLNVVLNTAGV